MHKLCFLACRQNKVTSRHRDTPLNYAVVCVIILDSVQPDQWYAKSRLASSEMSHQWMWLCDALKPKLLVLPLCQDEPHQHLFRNTTVSSENESWILDRSSVMDFSLHRKALNSRTVLNFHWAIHESGWRRLLSPVFLHGSRIWAYKTSESWLSLVIRISTIDLYRRSALLNCCTHPSSWLCNQRWSKGYYALIRLPNYWLEDIKISFQFRFFYAYDVSPYFRWMHFHVTVVLINHTQCNIHGRTEPNWVFNSKYPMKFPGQLSEQAFKNKLISID